MLSLAQDVERNCRVVSLQQEGRDPRRISVILVCGVYPSTEYCSLDGPPEEKISMTDIQGGTGPVVGLPSLGSVHGSGLQMMRLSLATPPASTKLTTALFAEETCAIDVDLGLERGLMQFGACAMTG